MRILYLIDSLRPGGKERQSVELLKGLHQRGVEITVVTLGVDGFFEQELKDHGVTVMRIARSSRWDLRPIIGLNRLVQRVRPNLLHSTCWMTSFFALPVARWHGLPLINGSIRNAFSGNSPRQRAERILLRVSDVRIGNSKAGFMSRGLSPTAPRNHVIHNGFDSIRIQKRDAKAEREMTELARGRKVVGMVAQFKRDKDYPTFFKAARSLLEQRNDVVFVCVGDGPEWEHLSRTHADRGDAIRFLGRRNEVETLVSQFTIGVLSTFTEGISNAIMEYMALGKPVVATDGGGTSEIVQDEVTGFLIPPVRPDILADRINRLLDNPDLAARLGRQGRDRLHQHFSFDALVSKTLMVYEQWGTSSRSKENR